MMPQDCGFIQSGHYHPNAGLLGPYVGGGGFLKSYTVLVFGRRLISNYDSG